PTGRNIHIVILRCKSAGHAEQCLEALQNYGRPDALGYGCQSYEFGRRADDDTSVILLERWADFAALDRLLTEKVVPALPVYNALLARDFDPGQDTTRITLQG
ncbi:hypothetical protein HA397_29360, partial [Escherichia coli]|nr:hypothetical protein [Escherichia coli]